MQYFVPEEKRKDPVFLRKVLCHMPFNCFIKNRKPKKIKIIKGLSVQMSHYISFLYFKLLITKLVFKGHCGQVPPTLQTRGPQEWLPILTMCF